MRRERRALLMRRVFQVLLVLQALHLGEHLVQMAQIYLLGWPPPLAKGVVSTLDVEKVHFVWNLLVLATVAWLLRRGIRSAWLVATLVWATLHTAEHGFLLTNALLSGLEGRPGILGAGGLLARLGWTVAGVTTWSRPTVHFAWNTGEVALLALAWATFAGLRLQPIVRTLSAALPRAATVGLLLLIPSTATAPGAAMTALAPIEIFADGFTDLRGIAIDVAGNVLVADRGTGRVIRIAPDRARTVVARGLRRPIGLAFDLNGEGRLLIVEEGRGRLLRREPSGRLTVLASGMRSPRWIAVAPEDGVVYLTAHGLRADHRDDEEDEDAEEHRRGEAILRLGAHGALTVFADGFKGLEGLAVRGGAVYAVTERLLGERERQGTTLVRIPIEPDGDAGRLEVLVRGDVRDPVGLALDRLGAVFFTAERRRGEDHRDEKGLILKWLPDGRLVTFATGLKDPRGLAFDATGHLLAAERRDHAGRLLRFRAPLAPVFHHIPAFTNQSPVSVSGTTEPGARLDLFVHDAATAVTGLSDASGAFSLPVPLMPNAPNTVEGSATPHAGEGLTSPPAEAMLTHDNVPPETQITGGPSGEINVPTATFSFTGTDNLTRIGSLQFAWRLDGRAWSAFSLATTEALSDLSEGTHIFEVKARDLAGNDDPTPASVTFTVRFGPTITSVDPPSGLAGTFVTITGTSLVASPTQITFNGVPAVVRSASPTSITTTVPIGATTGPLSVTTSRGTASQSFTVTTTQDFAIQVAPANGNVIQGASTSYSVALVSSSGTPFTGLATLTVSGLPPGLAGVFVPAPMISGGQFRTLTLTAGGAASVGSADLTVSASAQTDIGTVTRTATARVTVLPAGRTAVVGQFTLTDGTPIGGIRLTASGLTTTTDAGGNFQLFDVPAGTQMLGIDANAAQPGLPIYAVDVTVVSGHVTQLPPFRLTPPPPPDRFMPIANALADQVVTDPRFPGASITLPAGVTITGWDGTLKTRIALERLSPDALPVPPPPGITRSLYQVFFGTPMGGVPSAPLPLTVPNDQELDPGEQVELWYYDAAPFPGVPAGWRMAGLGTVTDDGTTVVSNPGVGIARFCGVCGLFCLIRQQGGQGNRNPDGPEGGDPVNLDLGQVIADKTDLVLPGRLPVVIHRTYNPLEPFGAIAGFELGLGPGWALSIDVALQVETSTLHRLIWPGNARFAFVRQPNGTFVNTTHGRFAGAVLTEIGGSYRLRFKDGTAWRFNRVPLIFGLFLLGEQADRNNNRLTIERDFVGRPTRLLAPDGRTVTVTLHPLNGRIGQVSDPAGRTVRYDYTSTFPARLERVTDPVGGVTRYAYAPDGRLLTITDPRGITYLSQEYDAQGRVLRQTQADGGIFTFAYEGPVGAHTRVTVTDPRGHVTTHRMDNAGFASEVVDALGQPTRQERDARGQVLATTDPLGRVTRFTYDAQGNLTSVTDAAGEVRTFTYEPTFNRVTSIADPLGNITRFEYDSTGNLTALVDPLGARTTLAYDPFGQPVSTTDPLGHTTTFAYDGAGNLTRTTDPLGNISTRAYDSVSRLTTQTDPLGRSTHFDYDALNQLTRVTEVVGGVTRFTYDQNGNLLTVTDASGNTIVHTYDAMDRLATRTDPVRATESFQYDRAGNLIRATDRKGQVTTYAYNALNRRTDATYADGATSSFVFDAAGRLIRASDSIGGNILNAYDVLDRLVAQTTALGTIGYQYDALGRRVRMDAPGRTPVAYTHDAASRLRTVAQAPFDPVTIDYDLAGRRTRLTLPNGVSTEYQYDAASRLTALTYLRGSALLGNVTYRYDANGSRNRTGGSFARTLLPDPVLAATHDAANRQVTFGDRLMAFDANGSLISISDLNGATGFSWDVRNRLESVNTPEAGISYAYDVFGRRIARTSDQSMTRFQYDGLDVVEQSDGSGGTSYLRSLDVDEVFVITNADGPRFVIADALGSTVAVLDAAGAIAADYTYDPFGTTASSNPALPNAFQFAGRDNEGIAGLYYYRSRYYAPALHRFVSEDPIDLAAGDPNLYLYVFDDPVNLTDPSGEIAPLLAACLAGGLTNVALDLLFSGRKQDLGGLLRGAALGCAEGALGYGALKLLKAAKLALAAKRAGKVVPKLGSAGGPGAGKDFAQRVKDAARAETDRCVFCDKPTTRAPGPDQSQIDHAIPKSRGGNNTLDNAQNTCRTCNLQKGTRTTEEFLNVINGKK